MIGETDMKRWARQPWLVPALGLLAVGASACAKTDAQAPAKEAPSAPAVAPEAAEVLPNEQRATSPTTSGADRWPQAEAQPKTDDGSPPAAAAPIVAPAPRPRAVGEEKKETAKTRAAKAKGELGAAGHPGAADEAAPALAVTESWTRLNGAFDGLTSALALSIPDCDAAERHRQNVCSLAERICALERDLPSTTPHRCNDGQTRCADATNRYNAKCER